ncbi:MAG: T9SS type A sorting domain-containing protein [Crocinitomix sp.]|nr:T9SS type A sorting domain-containing protein [Crocinitomix sp.]
MKKLIILLSLFALIIPSCYSQLTIGDIAFVGYNTDSGPLAGQNDGFAFITLTDISGAEIIYFTEEGWNDDTDVWVGNSEGHIEWTAPDAGVSCGSVIFITESAASVFTVSGGGIATLASGSGWSLSAGDQVLAYQAATAEPATIPTFIAAINGNDGDAAALDPVTLWDEAATILSSTSKSCLPFGLSNGDDCVALFIAPLTEEDNAKYTGTLTGTSTFLRGEINDRTNWDTDNGTAYNITPGAFFPSVTCVAPCSNPTIPAVTFSPTTFCDGESTTLTITGTFNDATAWYLYTGSCGGTDIGWTTGTTFEVTPVDPSTTYYVRGEGGCVTPGSCGEVEVTITPEDDASFSYEAEVYCPNGADPTPTVALADGAFTFDPAGLIIDGGTGEIDLSASDLGIYTIAYSTSGDCPSSSTATVTIEDDEAPIPDLADLPDILAECEVTELTNPSVTDNCTDPVIITNDADLPITDPGTTTFTWTYDDGNGNTTTQTQDVIIDDVSGPTPDDPALDDITDECEVSLLTSPGATDNCAGEVIVSSDAALPITTQGTTVVTWTYTDVNGNTTTQTQDIILNDATAPVPDDVPLDDFSSACEINELPTPTATDNCDGDISITSDAIFPISEATTVTWTYDDGNGNTVTQSQNIVFAPIDVSTSITDVITINANNTDATAYQWVDCADLSIIDGAIAASYTPDVNGDYAVIITEGECIDTSDCVAITQMSLNEQLEQLIEIYPNPASSEFVIIKSTIDIKQVSIVSMSGSLVQLNTKIVNGKINISEIGTGTYIMIIQTVSDEIVQKRLTVLN